jgi:hypothetical protein
MHGDAVFAEGFEFDGDTVLPGAARDIVKLDVVLSQAFGLASTGAMTAEHRAREKPEQRRALLLVAWVGLSIWRR